MTNSQRFVEPKVFLVGATALDVVGVRDYLEYSGNSDFLDAIGRAANDDVKPAEILISMYAKLCYKSLSIGQNANLTAVRDIKGNLAGIFKQAHGSCLEHVSVNFIVTDCSRVFTHEQVRHRVGSAYSQTSGRYCRIDLGGLRVVWDPILDGCEEEAIAAIEAIEKSIYLMECKKGLREPPEGSNAEMEDCFDGTTKVEKPELMWAPKTKGVDFNHKKKLTSAFRRFAPNGQSNEIGMTLNIRTIRHAILMRTSRYAEREIRLVYNQIYRLMKDKYPLLFADSKERTVDDLVEVYGMKMNPYERQLEDHELSDLEIELRNRGYVTYASDYVDDEKDEVPVGSGAEEEAGLPSSKKGPFSSAPGGTSA